jgi:hypothetical protein
MRARFQTTCSVCRRQIKVGNPIVIRGHAIHASCLTNLVGDRALEPKRRDDQALLAKLAIAERAGFR